MATITSVTNFVGSKQWTDTSAWQGGVVPGAADTAQIRGIRTQINQGTFAAWAGTRTITVDSTSGFPSSGTFYTATDRNQKVKINYTGTTATTFTGCSIDTAYFPWTVNNTPTYNIYGGNILDNTYVHFTPVIEVTGSVSAGIVIIEQGGYLKVHNGGQFGFQNYIGVRDGTLHASGSATFNFEFNNTVSNAGDNSRIFGENYQLSRIIFEGDDPRLQTTLTSDVNVGDGKLFVSNISNFAVDDFIIVKDPNLNLVRRDDGFRAAFTLPSGSMDECFNVAGISGSALLVSRMNSIDVEILQMGPGANTIITDSTRLEVGEKLVINNDVYTVQAVSDYDYLLRDYDFTQAGTTLADWETDTVRSAYFADFQKSSSPVSGSAYALIQHNTTSYRHLFVKNLMRQEAKVEAWISNYRNVDTGTNDGGALGVVMHADPLMDYDNGYDAFARTYFEVDRDNARYRLLQRTVSSDSTVLTSRANVPTNGLRKFTLDCRKGLVKGYIDDVLINESFMRSGGYFGRMGVFCTGNNSFTCTRFKIYAAAQQVTLDRTVNASVGNKVYETGAEFTHQAGNVVVKQASLITDGLANENLAYGYRGAREYAGDYVFPYMYNAATNNTNYNTRSTSTAFYNILNNQTVYDLNSYNFASNTTTTGSMIVDLGTTRTFTHVSFQEYLRSTGQYFSTGGYINIQTSNNLSTWTTVNLRGQSTDSFAANFYDYRRRETGDSVRTYELQSTQTARYIRFTRAGGNNTSTAENRWSSLGVRNATGGFKLQLNNVSDFNVGDRVMPMYNGSFNGYIQESNYYGALLNNSVPSSSWTSQLTEYYTVTAKDAGNKTITLDRPFSHSFLQGGERIYNLTRGVKFRGQRGNATWKRGRWNLFTGTNNGRQYIIKNAEFTGLATYYPTNQASNYDRSSFGHRSYPLYSADIYDGVTFYDNMPQQTSYNGHYYTAANVITRDSIWMQWHGRGWFTYFPGQYSAMYFAGNVYRNCIFGDNGFIGNVQNVYYNYNCNYGGSYGVQIPRLANIYTTNVFHTPQINQFKRNYANGGTGYGSRIESAQGFGNLAATIDFSDNMFEYMDDGLQYDIRFVPYWRTRVILPKRGNTDNRLTRYRNEGVQPSDRYVMQHIAGPHWKNYNNWGYDLIYQGDYTYTLKYPNEDYFRMYRVNTEWRNALFGTTLQIYDSSSVTFNYGFEYVHSLGQWALNTNTYTGSMAQFVLKDGSRYQSDVVIPKVTGSFEYWSGSVTLNGPGYFNIGLGQAALTGYTGIRNMTHNFNSSTPTGYRILTNTFDLDQLGSPFGRDWTTNTYNLNINLT